MATRASSERPSINMMSNEEISIHAKDLENSKVEEKLDYTQRGQWLRAAILGANDGLVTVASLMIGVGAVKQEIKTMLLTGFAGLVAGACSMGIGEFVSVHTQLDIEKAQLKREKTMGGSGQNVGEPEEEEELPNPMQATFASTLSFSFGAVVPLLAAVFIHDYKVRSLVVVCVVSMALMFFGGVGAVLGKTPVAKSSVRLLLGGWVAMAITYGITRSIGAAGLRM